MRGILRTAAFLIVLLMTLFSPLQTTQQAFAAQEYGHVYSQALQDAMLAEGGEICSSLVSIDRGNKDIIWQDDRVLVVTWTKFPQSYPVGKEVTTWWGDTWVTVVPELRNFVNRNELTDENTLRVEQVLGLPAESGNKWFAEVWVRPEDLFRPSPDPEINDTVADLNFKDTTARDHRTWFDNTVLSQYFGDRKYPWTRLGYTYDWGNPRSEVGLSEFVIKKGASVIVKSLYTNEGYIRLARGDRGVTPDSPATAPDLEKRRLLDTVFQVSTINALLQGVYDGEITCGDLKRQGDFGIGTFEGLDGEMVVLDNDIFQVKGDGTVISPENGVKSPFASVTFFEADTRQTVKDIDSSDSLQKLLDQTITNKNLIYGVRLDGSFKYVRTRSVPAQAKPYPPLAEVTKNQPTFEFSNIDGTLVGFWCPQFIQGINVPGYHLHFISKDRKHGGHLLDCKIADGLVQVDSSGDFHMMLPRGDEFGRAELSADRSEELEKVEK